MEKNKTMVYRFHVDVSNKKGNEINVMDLENIHDGSILFLYFPWSEYNKLAEKFGKKINKNKPIKDVPTHMIVKIGGLFYHVIGKRVYRLNSIELKNLLVKNNAILRGIGIPTEGVYAQGVNGSKQANKKKQIEIKQLLDRTRLWISHYYNTDEFYNKITTLVKTTKREEVKLATMYILWNEIPPTKETKPLTRERVKRYAAWLSAMVEKSGSSLAKKILEKMAEDIVGKHLPTSLTPFQMRAQYIYSEFKKYPSVLKRMVSIIKVWYGNAKPIKKLLEEIQKAKTEEKKDTAYVALFHTALL